MLEVFPLDADYPITEELWYSLFDDLFSTEGVYKSSDLNVTADSDGIGVIIAPGGGLVLYDSAPGGKRAFYNTASEKSGANEFPNPSFATNLDNWVRVGLATIIRDTGSFNSSPAAMRIDPVGAANFDQGAKITSALIKVNPNEQLDASCWFSSATVHSAKLRITEHSDRIVIANPDFETDVTNWIPSGATVTRDTTEHYMGAASMKIVTNGAGFFEGVYQNDTPAVSPGQVLLARVYAKGSGTVGLTARVQNSGGGTVQDYNSANKVLTSSWQEITVLTTALPANSAKVQLILTTQLQQAVTYYADQFEVMVMGAVNEMIAPGTGGWTKISVPPWITAANTKYITAEVLLQTTGTTSIYVDDFAIRRNFNWIRALDVADVTNPRVDRLVIQVRDSDVSGGGDTTQDVKFRIVPGTPTSGATLVNLTGAAAVPSNSLLLANILVPANAKLLVSGNIDNAVRSVARVKSSAQRLTLAQFPPASPLDGDEIILAVDTGVDWRFVYNAATSYWDFIGGPPLVKTVATSQTRANTAYGDLTTVGPDITTPRGGDYLVAVQAHIGGMINPAWGAISFAVAAGAATDARMALFGDPVGASTSGSAYFETLITLATNDLLRAKYKTSSGTINTSFADRLIKLLPQRIQ